MKNSILILITLFASLQLMAQDCLTYGLHRNFTENMEYFASLDPQTGDVELLSPIPELEGVQMGFAATNSRQGHFYFHGITESYEGYFYTINLSDGTVANMVEFPPAGIVGNIIEMHYHPYKNLIYALHWDELEQMEYLISIDPYTANITKIDSLTDVHYVQASFSALNYQSDEFSFIGVDYSDDYRLFTIDINTGDVLYQPLAPSNNINGGVSELEINPIRGNLYALHYDNVLNKEFFTRINKETGEVTIINEIPEVQMIQAGFSALNPQDGVYYFNGITQDYSAYVYSIDIYSGEVINQVSFNGIGNGNLKELQFPSLPPVVLSMSNTSACETDSILIQAPQGFSQYQWSNGSTEDHIYINDTSSYNITLTRNYGCSSHTSSMPVQMYDCNNYTDTFIQYEDSCLFNSEEIAMNFLSDIELNGTEIELKWNFVTTQADTIRISAQYSITENGLYELMMIFPCSDKSDGENYSNMLQIDHLNFTGIDQPNSFSWSIYPNPVNNFIQIETEKYSKPVLLKLFNASNQLMLQKPIQNSNEVILLDTYPNGVYFVVLETDLGVQTKKVIKI